MLACPKTPGQAILRASMAQPYPLAREFRGIRYTLLAPPESSQARFAFTGRFQNQEIVWDTTLITLTHYHAAQPKSAQTMVRTGFLEIGGETAHGRAIRVALDIPVIDEAAILRTIIMLRNYKRLHPGRHEFGIPHTFPPYTAG